MILTNYTTNHYLKDTGLLPWEQEKLLASLNAMSVFIDEPKPTELPASVYLSYYDSHDGFLGAARIEQNHTGVGVLVHIMLIERDRANFTELCELTVLWCLHKQLEPFTEVLTIPDYDYMHKFMATVHNRCADGKGCKVYSLPLHWKPVSLTSVILEF